MTAVEKMMAVALIVSLHLAAAWALYDVIRTWLQLRHKHRHDHLIDEWRREYRMKKELEEGYITPESLSNPKHKES